MDPNGDSRIERLVTHSRIFQKSKTDREASSQAMRGRPNLLYSVSFVVILRRFSTTSHPGTLPMFSSDLLPFPREGIGRQSGTSCTTTQSRIIRTRTSITGLIPKNRLEPSETSVRL